MLRLIERFLILWAEMARRGGWLVALLVIAAGIAAGYVAFANPATRLKVNTDTSEMLDANLPFQKNARALRDAFPQLKTDLVIIARAPTLDEADAYAAAIRERLIKRTDTFSAVFAPAEEPFFMENGLLYLDASELESRLAQMTKASGLIETLVKTPTADTLFASLAENDELAERSELGQQTLADIYQELGDVVQGSLAGDKRPFSWMGALDTGDRKEGGYSRIVYATPVLDFTRLQPAKLAVEAVRAEIADLEKSFDGRVDAYVTGDPALRAEELEAVTTGIGLSFGSSFVCVALLLFLCFRSAKLSLVTMASLVLTLIFTSAYAAVFIGELNLVSIAFTVLLVGLGLDFAIHLLLNIQERRGEGEDMKAALRGTMHDLGPALALAAVTTALAFFSFVPTEFDGIAQLGLIAGVGVIIALAVSLTFTPAVLGALPRPNVRSGGVISGAFAALDRVSVPIAIVTAIAGIASLALLPQARFDADPMSLRNPESQSVKGFNILFSDPDTIPYRLSRLVPSAEEAEATSAAVKKLETVRSARSLPDFVPDDQETKLELIDFAAGSLVFALDAEPVSAEDKGGAQLLETRLSEKYPDGPGQRLAGLLKRVREEGGADAMARIEDNIFAFWPQLIERLRAQLNADYVELDTLPEALTSRYRSPDGQWRVDILPEGDTRDAKVRSAFVDSVESVYPDVSGGALQTKKAGEVISKAMLEATVIAFAVIIIFLFLLVQNARLVFLMVFPLAIAAALTTATGVLFDIPFNYANVIVLPLLLGVGVDSGIHLVMRQEHIEHGEKVHETSTARAVLFSALTTVASFGSLMLSPHRGTASMGELLSIAIGYTLICTLILLPVAFRLGRRRAK